MIDPNSFGKYKEVYCITMNTIKSLVLSDLLSILPEVTATSLSTDSPGISNIDCEDSEETMWAGSRYPENEQAGATIVSSSTAANGDQRRGDIDEPISSGTNPWPILLILLSGGVVVAAVMLLRSAGRRQRTRTITMNIVEDESGSRDASEQEEYYRPPITRYYDEHMVSTSAIA